MFILAAALSVYAATHLSNHADTISRKSNMNGFLTGTLLLAIATSLPELTATISAALIDNPDIAVGNGLGSMLFNLFVLFLFDLHFRRRKLFLQVSKQHLYSGTISLILTIVAIIALGINHSYTILNISIPSLLIIAIYGVGMYLTSKQDVPNESDTKTGKDESLSQAKLRFLLFASIILVAGSVLSLSGDALASATGISATFIGSILIAAATSLPDAVSVYVALKLGNPNLAVGTILGSNLFNIIVVAISDIVYFNGSVWQDTANSIMIIAIIGLILTGISMIIIARKHTRSLATYFLPSLLVILCYGATIGYLVFS
ncbi:sodium:calcium antiporter [Terribacillus saccharophilus]|uniref:sodium:calcium antiporter n=1 Tax=Terribacillus saccharophilus TaxID=361277 RepID=UPI0020D06B81|nr:sodium:calcium antiporter [Terribacillus saccharophilus]